MSSRSIDSSPSSAIGKSSRSAWDAWWRYARAKNAKQLLHHLAVYASEKIVVATNENLKPRWMHTPGSPTQLATTSSQPIEDSCEDVGLSRLCCTQEEVPEGAQDFNKESHSTDHREGSFRQWRGGGRGVDNPDRDGRRVFLVLFPVSARCAIVVLH